MDSSIIKASKAELVFIDGFGFNDNIVYPNRNFKFLIKFEII